MPSIETDFQRELAEIDVEAMGWTLLEPGGVPARVRCQRRRGAGGRFGPCGYADRQLAVGVLTCPCSKP